MLVLTYLVCTDLLVLTYLVRTGLLVLTYLVCTGLLVLTYLVRTDLLVPACLLAQVSVAGLGGVRCLRLTFVGELGFELHMPAEHAPAIYSALWEAGEALERSTGRPVRNAGYL